MKTKSIPLNEATDKQLRKFAEIRLGISLTAKATRDAILAAIASIDQTGKAIVDDEGPDIGTQATGPVPRNFAHIPGAGKRLVAKGASMREDPPVLLVIAKTEQEGGDEPVPVSVNGSPMWIPRGVLVEIPYRFYAALQDAVKCVYRQNGDGHGDLEGRDVPSYPVDVKYLPSEEEIAEWIKRTSGNAVQAAA